MCTTTTITAPEFCPNPACCYFNRETAAAVRWWRRAGSFDTLCRGPIQRFRCLSCGKTCSTQTFSIHYWTHSTCDLQRLREDLDSAGGELPHRRTQRYPGSACPASAAGASGSVERITPLSLPSGHSSCGTRKHIFGTS